MKMTQQQMNQRMMKYLLFFMISFAILSMMTYAKTVPLSYTIYFDTHTQNSAEVKAEVLRQYSDLVQGVHEESEVTILRNNLSRFMWEEDMHAQWKNNQLVITIGNGKGISISGDLSVPSFCLPQPQPKSLLQELFS